VDHFKKTDGNFVSTLRHGSLSESANGWDYYDEDGGLFHFDKYGRLLQSIAPLKPVVTLIYDGPSNVLIKSDDGGQVEVVFDSDYQPMNVNFTGGSIGYTYSDTASVATYSFGGQNHTRTYTYSNTSRARLLASITDERGIQQARWSYDNLGRAIASEHAGGTQHIDITYSDDNKTITVVNEFRKLTKYHFSTFNGIKRITSVEGEPSPNCPASNASYTYTERGLVLTKADAKGFITTYTYNDRGLETSRTEASGTPQARVTTTEWDPTRFLRTKVVEPTRTTVYTYDDQGRETSRQVSAR
jgi:YD repeat-containing protein